MKRPQRSSRDGGPTSRRRGVAGAGAHRDPAPSAGVLAERLAAAGFDLDAPARERFWRFHQLLRAADREQNLTRIRGFLPMVEKHYVDCLLPARLTRLPSPLMDLGSGGGFPGIPLAIAFPQLQLCLVEGRRLRVAFLQDVVAALGLLNVTVVARKLNPDDRVPVAGVITRAVAAAADTLTRVRGSVAPGGRVVLMKGPQCDDEVAAVAAQAELADWALVEDHRYALPWSGDARRLLVYERHGAAASNNEVAPTSMAHAAAEPAATIVSGDNDRVKHWRKLTSGRGVRKHGETLLSGRRYIAEALRDRADLALGLLLAPDEPVPDAVPRDLPRWHLAPALLRELDAGATGGPLLWLRTPDVPPWRPDAAGTGITLIVPLQLPDNLGAVLRTAEALGVRDVALTSEAASPFHPRALRAAGAAALRLPLFAAATLAETCTQTTLPMWALDTSGTPIDAAVLPDRFGLVVGLEGPGTGPLPATLPRVTIPMADRAESLNAAVAAGIALYVLRRPRAPAL